MAYRKGSIVFGRVNACCPKPPLKYRHFRQARTSPRTYTICRATMDKSSHRSAVASKTTFEALQVDSGEETEEKDVVQEHVGLVVPRAASVALMPFIC
jgi:hypothetical protein